MKISTLKKVVAMSCVSLFLTTTAMALDHGSMKGDNLPLYDQGAVGGNVNSTPKTATLDFRIVTIGEKSWAWNKVSGAYIDTGADWCSQFRYWSSTNAKTENNMINRNATANLADEVWAVTTSTMPSPVKVSFFQNLVGLGMSESEAMDYDPAMKNSVVNGDVTAPSVTCRVSEVNESVATIVIEGDEDESGAFYYITGEGFEDVSFSRTYDLTGLSPNRSYTFTITPIDFSGNEGLPQVVNFSTTGMVHITSGIAKDIKFVLKSTNNELEYYYELTDRTQTFRDAFLKITPAGGDEFEVKPTISPDGFYAYGKVSDAKIANKVLGLNCGYFIYEEGDPIWDNYITINTEITDGALSGTPIKHQMGSGVNDNERESEVPVLYNVEVLDVTADYIILNLEGEDNSGTVYYEISGAKQTVNAFRTGTYYLTAIEMGKIYDLSIVAKDLSGNYSASQSVKVKTANARGNIMDNENLGYNSLTKPGATGGELTSIIKYSGNMLTIGCTTDDTRYSGNAFHSILMEAYKPFIKINGTIYYLENETGEESETAIRTASLTFTGAIGEDENAVDIEAGANIDVMWSVFWAGGNGNFFTETFRYIIGDNGQEDTDAPEKPVLSLNNGVLTWFACKDVISGVKHYRVEEETVNARAMVNTVIIPDLGEESFSYTLIDPDNKVTVTAVDFAGNEVSESSANIVTGLDDSILAEGVSVYPNPTTEIVRVSGIEVSEIIIFSLQGQLVCSAFNTNTVNVSSLNNGLYILNITDRSGVKTSVKLHVRK